MKANKVLCSRQRNVAEVFKLLKKLGFFYKLRVLPVLMNGPNCPENRRTDMMKLEKIQKEAATWILAWRHQRCITQLRILNVFDFGRLVNIKVFSYLHNYYEKSSRPECGHIISQTVVS